MKAQTASKTRAILDSLEILKNLGGIFGGAAVPPSPEETRYFNILDMLMTLPLNEAKKLTSNSNKIVRVYGFSILARVYFDSITKSDLNIFDDTAKLLLYTENGLVDAGITVGQGCESAYNSIIEEREIKARQPSIEEAIKIFINSNAKYPTTYLPIEFSKFNWGEVDSEIDYYEIKHRYTIKNNHGEIVNAQEYFILDKDYKIIIIESVRSKIIKIDPPKIEEWIKTYGKS